MENTNELTTPIRQPRRCPSCSAPRRTWPSSHVAWASSCTR